MPFILLCCSNCCAHQSLCFPFHPYPCPALCSTLPLSCNQLDFYLPSALPSTRLCLCPVPILTPGLRLPSVESSNMSLLCHLYPLLLPSLSRYPSHLPLPLTCPPLRLTHASQSPYPSCLLSCPICRIECRICKPYPSSTYDPALPFVQASACP